MCAMRILVVDDEPAVRDSLRRALQLEGYEVELAGDGQEALERLSEDGVDAVVLDVSMPRLDGLEACRRLRKDGNSLPVLMLTARELDLVALELQRAAKRVAHGRLVVDDQDPHGDILRMDMNIA